MTSILNRFFRPESPQNLLDSEDASNDPKPKRVDRTFTNTLLFLDFILCCLIVYFIPYTEIDWIAYMQEVEGFLSGEMDYTKLKGDTGPLVYPAGFVYLYSALYYITNHGKNILLAQVIFIFVYIANSAVVMEIFRIARLPKALCVLLLLSKRVHSIFVLRCFNDCFAMLFAYIAIYYFMKKRWNMGCVWFSLAVSIKMNVLLMAPGLFCIMVTSFSVGYWIWLLTICASIQILLGLPFLTTYPVQYLTKAFELSRVFTYKWTVNFRFLPEEIFISKPLGLFLLAGTIITWILLAYKKWTKRKYVSGNRPENIAATMFESSFAGILFARTLHYQFYSWFFHQLPLLLYFSCWHGTSVNPLVNIWKFAVLVGIEYAFNKYPSTELSSAVLVASLALIQFVSLFVSSGDPPASDAKSVVGTGSLERTGLLNTRPTSTEDEKKKKN
jgi:alpha-1,3-mannosyltransferase